MILSANRKIVVRFIASAGESPTPFDGANGGGLCFPAVKSMDFITAQALGGT